MAQELIIREAAFAARLAKACDANPHCPDAGPNSGRLRWIKDELKRKFDIDISFQSLSMYMQGVMKPRRDKAGQIAQVLGVDDAWLYLGQNPVITQKESKVRNAMADGAVNVIAGFIAMDGGTPAFPDDGDKRAKRENIDLYAVIKGASYAFCVVLGTQLGSEWHFEVPHCSEEVMVLGVAREGFGIDVVEIPFEVIEAIGPRVLGATRKVVLSEAALEAQTIKSFATRL